MADPTKAWNKAFTSGSKEMQNRLMKVHAKNPAFQSWLKTTGYAGGESVKQASKEVMQSERSKKLVKKSLAAYGATKGTRMGSEDGSGEALRDTVAPLTRDQYSKVQTAKREAEKAGKLDTKEKRLQFLKKLAVKPAAPAPAEDFDEIEHEDHLDTHRSLHITGVGSKYSMDEEVKDAADEGEYDYEGDMAKSQLRSIMFNAKRMHDMLEDNTNLPEWVQSKITLAEDYISTAANYMQGEMNEEAEQIDELVRSTVPGSRDVKAQISKETDLDKANKLVRDALAKQQQIAADREAAAAEVRARAAAVRASDRSSARVASAAIQNAAKATGAETQSMTAFAKKLGGKLITQRLKVLKPVVNVLGLGATLGAVQKTGKIELDTEVDGKPDVTAQPDAVSDPKAAAVAAAAATATVAPKIARQVQTARQADVAAQSSAATRTQTTTKVDTAVKTPGKPSVPRVPPVFGTPAGRDLGRMGRYHVGGRRFKTPVTTSGAYSFGYTPRSYELGYEPGMAEETQMNEGAAGGYGRLPSILRAKRAKMKAQGKPMTEEGRKPTTPEHEKFAALAPPHDKITHADKIAGALRNKMKNKLTKGK